MKRILSLFLVITMLSNAGFALALNEGEARTVIGADLTAEQINQVYNAFGITRDDVRELVVTNAEERQYLEGLIDSNIIGSRSISCVYVEIRGADSGIDVSTTNINWCTDVTYRNALATAGISDAKVIVAAPFGVSGTAALTGIYKAYEDITGTKLDETAKLVGTQELVVTGELADQIGDVDAASIVNELKYILDETVNMTDDEIREEIRRIAQQYDVSISDGIIDQLVKLCREMEGLSADELKAKVESVQKSLKSLAGAQESAGKAVNSIKNFFTAVGNFFSNIFNKVTGK